MSWNSVDLIMVIPNITTPNVSCGFPPPSPLSITITIDGGSYPAFLDSTTPYPRYITPTSISLSPTLSPGNHSLAITVNRGQFGTELCGDTFAFDIIVVAIATFHGSSDQSVPTTATATMDDSNANNAFTLSTSFDLPSPVCLHGDSLITTPSGLVPISQLTSQDFILTPDHQVAKIISVPICWVQMESSDRPHDAIIFEPDSLGSGLPTHKLIIDPGHPICLPGQFDLKPSATYLDSNNPHIYPVKWTDLPEIQAEIASGKSPSQIYKRYDLVLESPHTTYLANGIVVRARKSWTEAGYEHRFASFG